MWSGMGNASPYSEESALPHDDLVQEGTNTPDVDLVIVVLHRRRSQRDMWH